MNDGAANAATGEGKLNSGLEAPGLSADVPAELRFDSSTKFLLFKELGAAERVASDGPIGLEETLNGKH